MLSALFLLTVLGVYLSSVYGQAPSSSQLPQLTNPRLTEDQERALFNTGNGESQFKLGINSVTGPSFVDNAAGRQSKGDKPAFPFLDTLPTPGSAIYLTTLKPCGLIIPHVHPRATEQYIVISGIMYTGLAEESTGLQNITGMIYPGQSFVAPQGLLHYNANRQCSPLVFLQIFDSIDPGTVRIVNALASLNQVDPQSISAAGASGLNASQYGAFALDSGCLKSCGLPAGGLADLSGNLSPEMKALVGISNAPAPAAGSSGR